MALREHAEQRFNSGMVISLQYEQDVMSFPTSVLAILPLAEKVRRFHQSLIRSCSLRESPEKPCRRAILNLGGIANLTVLDADPTRVFGFDTGPANAPLDRSGTPFVWRSARM